MFSTSSIIITVRVVCTLLLFTRLVSSKCIFHPPKPNLINNQSHDTSPRANTLHHRSTDFESIPDQIFCHKSPSHPSIPQYFVSSEGHILDDIDIVTTIAHKICAPEQLQVCEPIKFHTLSFPLEAGLIPVEGSNRTTCAHVVAVRDDVVLKFERPVFGGGLGGMTERCLGVYAGLWGMCLGDREKFAGAYKAVFVPGYTNRNDGSAERFLIEAINWEVYEA